MIEEREKRKYRLIMTSGSQRDLSVEVLDVCQKNFATSLLISSKATKMLLRNETKQRNEVVKEIWDRRKQVFLLSSISYIFSYHQVFDRNEVFLSFNTL